MLLTLFLAVALAAPESVLLGGLFDKTLPPSGAYGLAGNMRAAAFQMAIDDVNQRTDILPNTTILTQVIDVRADPSQGMLGVFQLLNSNAVGVVGASGSAVSISSQLVARSFAVPQISYASTSPELSNKALYQYFLRVVPPDNFQGQALANIAKYYGWTSVATIYTTDSYGTLGITAFTDAAATLGITVVTAQGFPVLLQDVTPYLTAIKQSGARVIVLNAVVADATVVVKAAIKMGLFEPEYVWLGTDGWATNAVITADLRSNVTGMLGTTPSAGTGPIHDAFVNAWNTKNLFPGLAPDAKIYHAYDSGMAFAYAIDACIRANKSYTGASLLSRLLNTTFEGVTGTVRFDANGDRLGAYDVVNLQGPAGFKVVARWDRSTGLVPLPDAVVVWPRNGSQPSGAALLPCPRGSYTGSGSRCIPCPPGYFSTSVNSLKCTPCAAGNYSSDAGSTSCSMCQPGSFSDEGASVCMLCDVTSYNPIRGASVCTQCPSSMSVGFRGAKSIGECVCNAGFYADNSTATCASCPTAGTCHGGAAWPVPSAGAWGESASTVMFLRCHPPSSCPGGAARACAEGYEGDICSICSPGYFRSHNECRKCVAISPVRFAFLLLIGCILMWFGYKIANYHILSISDRLGLGTTIGTAAAFLQTTSVLGTIGSTSSESAARSLMQAVGVVNFDFGGLGVSCDTHLSFQAGYALRVLFPVLIGAIMLLTHLWNRIHCEIFARCVKGHVTQEAHMEMPPLPRSCSWRDAFRFFFVPHAMSWRRTVNFMLMVLDMGYLFVTSAAFEVFGCFPQNDGTQSLTSVPSIRCFTPAWGSIAWMGFLAIALYGIGVPLLFLWIYKEARIHVSERWFIRTYGWLVSRFKRHLFWWESVVIARKLLLTFSVVTFSFNYRFQGLGAMIALVTSLVLEVHFRPNVLLIHNNLTSYLLFVNVCTLILVLLSDAPLSDSTATAMQVAINVLTVMLIATALLACAVILVKQVIAMRKVSTAGPAALREQRRKEFMDLFKNLRISVKVVEEWLHTSSQDDLELLRKLASDIVRTRDRLGKSGIELADLEASAPGMTVVSPTVDSLESAEDTPPARVTFRPPPKALAAGAGAGQSVVSLDFTVEQDDPLLPGESVFQSESRAKLSPAPSQDLFPASVVLVRDASNALSPRQPQTARQGTEFFTARTSLSAGAQSASTSNLPARAWSFTEADSAPHPTDPRTGFHITRVASSGAAPLTLLGASHSTHAVNVSGQHSPPGPEPHSPAGPGPHSPTLGPAPHSPTLGTVSAAARDVFGEGSSN